MKRYCITTLLLVCLSLSAFGQKNKADFGGQAAPYQATIVIEDVDCETTANIDLLLPKNFKWIVDSVEAIVTTAPSAVTTKAKVGLFEWDGNYRY